MNKRKLFLITLFFLESFGALAAEMPQEAFMVSGTSRIFVRDADHKILITSDCWQNETYHCEAFQVLKKVSFKKEGMTTEGGKNPGSPLCENFGGTIVIAHREKDEAEYSMCQFTDGSLIDTGTLTYFAKMNDLVAKKN